MMMLMMMVAGHDQDDENECELCSVPGNQVHPRTGKYTKGGDCFTSTSSDLLVFLCTLTWLPPSYMYLPSSGDDCKLV